MRSSLTWQNDDRCVIGDITFQVLPAGYRAREHQDASMKGAEFLLFKEPPLIDQYAEVVEELRPLHIVELGIFQGGGTVLLSELAHPRVLVAIDHKPAGPQTLREYISRNGLDRTVRIYDDVDQADRARLAEILDEEFGDNRLDLVVDDCSHMYGATRTSFNELFPRLRPGGVYLIEDWSWAHTPGGDGWWPDEVPLTKLVIELLLAQPYVPGLISELTVYDRWLRATRGDVKIDPRDFDISACSRPRGRSLLASGERVTQERAWSAGRASLPVGSTPASRAAR